MRAQVREMRGPRSGTTLATGTARRGRACSCLPCASSDRHRLVRRRARLAGDVPRGAGREPGPPLPFALVYWIANGRILLQRDYFDSMAMVERQRIS